MEFESEREQREREHMRAVLRREEYLTVLMSIVECKLSAKETNVFEPSKELALDIISHVDDAYPLP